MPIYDYECVRCGEPKEVITSVDRKPKWLKCPVCSKQMKPVMVNGHGGIQTDGDVKWLESACETLLPADHRRLETRGEYKRYLKEHNITPMA